jgi:hypothetical protein
MAEDGSAAQQQQPLIGAADSTPADEDSQVRPHTHAHVTVQPPSASSVIEFDAAPNTVTPSSLAINKPVSSSALGRVSLLATPMGGGSSAGGGFASEPQQPPHSSSLMIQPLPASTFAVAPLLYSRPSTYREPVEAAAPRFHYLQILLIFFIIPLIETLFWVSLPLDYNTETDQNPDARVSDAWLSAHLFPCHFNERLCAQVANFGILCLFVGVYYCVGLYFGLSASNYLTRVWKNKHGALTVLGFLSIIMLVYLLMWVGGASQFSLASALLSVLCV